MVAALDGPEETSDSEAEDSDASSSDEDPDDPAAWEASAATHFRRATQRRWQQQRADTVETEPSIIAREADLVLTLAEMVTGCYEKAGRMDEMEALLGVLRRLPAATEDLVPDVRHVPRLENQLAHRVRSFIEKEMKTELCACCNRLRRRRDFDCDEEGAVTLQTWDVKVLHLELLRADRRPTAAMPRDRWTTFVHPDGYEDADDEEADADASSEEDSTDDEDGHDPKARGRDAPDANRFIEQEEDPRRGPVKPGEYCLQPAAVICDEEGRPTLISLCSSCMGQLTGKKPRVPKESLVRVDTGSIPSHLKPLSLMEELLLSRARAVRVIGIMKPSGDKSLSQMRYRGHMIAFRNVDVDDVRQCLPLRFEDIPKIMQVRIRRSGYMYVCIAAKSAS